MAPVAKRSWYLATCMHFMGSTNDVPLWAVGFLRRGISPTAAEIVTFWDWVEGLPWDEAVKLLEKEKYGLVRTTSSELRKALSNA